MKTITLEGGVQMIKYFVKTISGFAAMSTLIFCLTLAQSNSAQAATFDGTLSGSFESDPDFSGVSRLVVSIGVTAGSIFQFETLALSVFSDWQIRVTDNLGGQSSSAGAFQLGGGQTEDFIADNSTGIADFFYEIFLRIFTVDLPAVLADTSVANGGVVTVAKAEYESPFGTPPEGDGLNFETDEGPVSPVPGPASGVLGATVLFSFWAVRRRKVAAAT